MMFWYIGGILAGFAIGYVIAIYQNRGHVENRRAHKRERNICRNCKYMEIIFRYGTLQCKKYPFLSNIPKACASYQRIEDTNNEN